VRVVGRSIYNIG
jgi:hypothetical protein